VRELALELAAASAQDVEAECLGAVTDDAEQARLADPSGSVEQEKGAAAGACSGQEPLHQFELDLALEQGRPRARGQNTRGYPRGVPMAKVGGPRPA